MTKLHSLLLFLLVACQATPAPHPALEPPIRVLLLGDSISIGYTPHVREALQHSAVVVRPTREGGAAENCQGTTHGVQHVQRWLQLEGGDWDIIHFNFGLHDLKRVDPVSRKNSNLVSDPNQAPPEVYAQQLRTIVEALSATDARLVFATTTPVPEGGVRPHRDPQDVERYNRLALAVMEEFDVEVDDLYAFAAPRVEELMLPANVHFTKVGSAALGRRVAEELRRVAGWEAR